MSLMLAAQIFLLRVTLTTDLLRVRIRLRENKETIKIFHVQHSTVLVYRHHVVLLVLQPA